MLTDSFIHLFLELSARKVD